MKKLALLCLSILLLATYSCKKTDPGSSYCNSIGVVTDSLYYNSNLGVDQTTFSYDGLGRVTSYTTMNHDTVKEKVTFSYPGNLIIRITTNRMSVVIEEDTITLNDQKLSVLEKTYTFNDNNSRQTIRNYDSNNHLVKTYLYQYPAEPKFDTGTFFWNNGDMVKLIYAQPDTFINNYSAAPWQLGDRNSINDLFFYGGATSFYKNTHLASWHTDMHPLYGVSCSYSFDSKGRIIRALYSDQIGNWWARSFQYNCL